MNALLGAIGKALCCQSLGKSPFYPKHFQLPLYLTPQHHDKAITKHKQTVGNNQGVIAIKPLVKLMLLSKNMNTAPVLHVIIIGWTIKADIAGSLIFSGMNRPWDALLTQQPVEVIVGKFRKCRTGHVREFHLRFFRSRMARVALSDVSWSRTRCLCHLVILSSARIVIVIQETGAEVLRCQLYHIGKYPRIQPIIPKSIDFHC